ncbi:hypothetical protein V8F20_005645 [Naviculisporaceae sp. PSN 640]
MVFGTPNCTVIPDQVPSDPGIAGAGVLLSSTITAGLALVMSGSLVIQEFFQPHLTRHNPNPSKIRRKLLNGYSDQQILVGIGVQSIGLAKSDVLVPYHFFIIWMLSLLSMATHNATLLTLVKDLQRDRVLRWLRQFLMFVNLALSCVFGAFVLQSKARGLPNTLPIACSWTFDQAAREAAGADGTETKNNVAQGLDYFGTIITVAGNCVVFGLATWYLQSRLQRFYKTVQLLGLVLMAGIAIGATVRVFLLSQAFGNPDVKLSDQGEKSWSFGQLLSMLMLVLPVISAIEILRGEIAMAPPVQEEDKELLYNGELDSNPKIVNRF